MYKIFFLLLSALPVELIFSVSTFLLPSGCILYSKLTHRAKYTRAEVACFGRNSREETAPHCGVLLPATITSPCPTAFLLHTALIHVSVQSKGFRGYVFILTRPCFEHCEVGIYSEREQKQDRSSSCTIGAPFLPSNSNLLRIWKWYCLPIHELLRHWKSPLINELLPRYA